MSFKQSSFPKNLQKLDKSDRLLSPLSITVGFIPIMKTAH